MVDVAAVSCISGLYRFFCLFFASCFALMFVAMKLAECYPHRIGTNNSFSTLQVRTVRLNVPGTVSECTDSKKIKITRAENNKESRPQPFTLPSFILANSLFPPIHFES